MRGCAVVKCDRQFLLKQDFLRYFIFKNTVILKKKLFVNFKLYLHSICILFETITIICRLPSKGHPFRHLGCGKHYWVFSVFETTLNIYNKKWVLHFMCAVVHFLTPRFICINVFFFLFTGLFLLSWKLLAGTFGYSNPLLRPWWRQAWRWRQHYGSATAWTWWLQVLQVWRL